MTDIECPCLGTGWIECDDECEKCIFHFEGQLHPHTRNLLLDDPERLDEEETEALFNHLLLNDEQNLQELQRQAWREKEVFARLEREFLNKRNG